VLRGTYSTQKFAQVLKDLSRLALLQGARLEELCALKKSNVHKREDGYWLEIGGGKTEAAVEGTACPHQSSLHHHTADEGRGRVPVRGSGARRA
jgi:integrase